MAQTEDRPLTRNHRRKAKRVERARKADAAAASDGDLDRRFTVISIAALLKLLEGVE